MTSVVATAELMKDVGEGEVMWLVEDGAIVETGDAIAEIETAKSSCELLAPVSGRLEIVLGTGSIVEPGVEIGRIHA